MKLDSDDKLPLNKAIEIPVIIIEQFLLLGLLFYKNNKYYPQIFLDECLI